MLLPICLSVVGTWHHLLVAGDPPDPFTAVMLSWQSVSVSKRVVQLRQLEAP